MKSEPNVWSIDQQIKIGSRGTNWDGVRNYQARNNLKKMKKGDLCFFYHSNIGKEIVGIVKVIKEAFIDKTDKKKSFSEGHKPSDILMETFMEIQTLPKINQQFAKFLKIFAQRGDPDLQFLWLVI